MGLRCASLLVLAGLAAGWAVEPTPSPPSGRVVAAKPVDGELAIAVEGMIDNAAPVAHHPVIPWIPLVEVTPDGASVATGDNLATFDTKMIRQWIGEQRRQLAQLAAERAVVRQQAKVWRSELVERRRELAAAVALNRAKLASRQADDAVAETAARRQAELTAAESSRLADRVAAAESLLAAGQLGLPAVELARAAAATATARAESARREMNAWDQQTARAAAAALARQVTDAEAALARDGDGPDSRQALAERISAADEQARRGELERVEGELARREALAARPRLIAQAHGLVRWRDRSIRPGVKLPTTPCVFVLDPAQTVAVVRLPEPLRDLVAPWNAQGVDGRAELEIPALPGVPAFPARILAVATVPEMGGDGIRTFKVTLALDGAPTGLRPGMLVRGRLLAPLPKGAAAVPRWAVVQRGDPRLALATPESGGEPVWVRGVASDLEFLAFSGLPPRVRALTGARTQVQAPRRLAGVIEAADAVPVHLLSQDWEIVDIVPDGAPVQRGQVIARLVKASMWLDPDQIRWDRDSGVARADGVREASRLRAQLDLLTATDEWQNAEGEAQRARYDLLGQELERQRGAVAAAGVRLAEAVSRLATARAGAAEAADPRAAPALSASQKGRRDQELLAAQVAWQQAGLEAAAARHPPLVDRGLAESAARSANDRAADAGKSWVAARRSAAQAEDRADRAWARTLRQIDRNSEQMADEVVLAPLTGRAFHPPGRNLRPGLALDTLEPFLIVPEATGPTVRRRLALEAPSHFAGRWTAGARIQVQIAGLGRLNATVLTVGTWYGPSSASRAAAEAGTVAPDEPVFNLVLILEVPAAQADRALPGASAWIDVGTETVDLGSDEAEPPTPGNNP